MMIIRTPEEMRAWSEKQRRQGSAIGFVPTMGALHEGHMSLVRAAVSDNDSAVASIFVNPTQFAPTEDFDQYPRPIDEDMKKLEKESITAVYMPTAAAMYPENYSTYVLVEEVSQGLCGGSRPHFFRGVATVVTKLFNAVKPHRAYFGQKDAQQCAVIKRMVRDLDMGIEIVEMPIVREADGLAMSSRNQYLSAEDRKKALCLSRALFQAETMLREGERNSQPVVDAVRAVMSDVIIDYVSLVNEQTMKPVEVIEGPVTLAVAALLPTARLIDNIKFDPDVHQM